VSWILPFPEAKYFPSRLPGSTNPIIPGKWENAAVETAVETAKPGGRVVLCGIPAADRVSFRASSARRKGLSIMMVRRMKHTYPRAIRMAAAGQVDLRSLVTHRFPLERAAEAFELAARRAGLKIIITP